MPKSGPVPGDGRRGGAGPRTQHLRAFCSPLERILQRHLGLFGTPLRGGGSGPARVVLLRLAPSCDHRKKVCRINQVVFCTRGVPVFLLPVSFYPGCISFLFQVVAAKCACLL